MRLGANDRLPLVALALLLGLVGPSSAEQEGPYGMKLGAGSRLILGLDVATRYSDNYYSQPDNEESAVGLIVKPSALLLIDRGELRTELTAAAEAGAFNLEGDPDDYLDGLLRANVEWAPLTRHRFIAGAGWRFDHDPFGTRRTEGTPFASADLDRWQEKSAGVVYHFGAPGATINLEGALSASEREYQTNRSTTRFLDYDTTGVRGTAYYRISSKTSLLAEVITGDINYDDVAPGFVSRAGEVTRYRVGARWLATGKTTGDLRIGRVEREFDAPGVEGYEELDWQAALGWEPRARDRIAFVTGREPEESYINAASIIDNQYYKLSWTHDWTALVLTRATYEYNDLDFRGIDRQDDLQSLLFEVEYKPSRRVGFFGDITLRERDSNVPLRNYDETVVSAGIRMTY